MSNSKTTTILTSSAKDLLRHNVDYDFIIFMVKSHPEWSDEQIGLFVRYQLETSGHIPKKV